MPKNSIDSLATLTARQAQSQMAMLQSDIRKLRDNIAAFSRGARTPVIRTKRGTIKGSTTTSPWEGAAGIGLALLGDAGLFGDAQVKVGGAVTVGGLTFSQSYASTQSAGGGGDGSSGGDVGSGYTSNAQSASRQSDRISFSLRIR